MSSVVLADCLGDVNVVCCGQVRLLGKVRALVAKAVLSTRVKVYDNSVARYNCSYSISTPNNF